MAVRKAGLDKAVLRRPWEPLILAARGICISSRVYPTRSGVAASTSSAVKDPVASAACSRHGRGTRSTRLFSTAAATEPRVDVARHETASGQRLATITVSNPQKLNVVNSAILDALTTACHDLAKDQSLRAVILTGGKTSPGKVPSFIGGADIKEMYHLTSSKDAKTFITRIHLACRALRDIPVPVVARVHGLSLGAGLEIMAACDLRVATKDSTFAMPEVKIGIPSVVEAALLPGLIGMGRTRRLLYLAENIDAATAERWGLVEEVVSDEASLDSTVSDWVSKLVAVGPAALRQQKSLVRRWEDCNVSEGIEAGVKAFGDAFEGGATEPREMMGQFMSRKR